MEDDYDMLEDAEEAPASQPTTMMAPFLSASSSTLASYFSNTSAASSWSHAEVTAARSARLPYEELSEDGGVLLIDMMLGDLVNPYERPYQPSSLYPANTASSLSSILDSVQQSSSSRKAKDEIVLYLLLDRLMDDSGQVSGSGEKEVLARFKNKRRISDADQLEVLGRWELDHGFYEAATIHLSNPGVSSYSASSIIASLATLPQPSSFSAHLTVRYMSVAKVPLQSYGMREVFVKALVLDDFVQAWSWTRDGSYAETLESQLRNESIVSEEGIQEELSKMVKEERERLLTVVLKLCLIPSPRRVPMQKLLVLPMDHFEQAVLTKFLLDPQSRLPSSSFDVLHDLLTLRLLSLGLYSSAIDLDRRVTELDRNSDHTILNSQTKQKRRQMVQEMVDVLPEVQRKLLVVENDARANPASASSSDLGMSWEPIHKPATPVVAPSPQSQRHLPLSASVALRSSSNPNIALYQAMVSANPSSPVPPQWSPAVPPQSYSRSNGGSPSHRTGSPFNSTQINKSGSSPAPSQEKVSPLQLAAQSGIKVGTRMVGSGSQSMFKQMATSQLRMFQDRGSPAPVLSDGPGPSTKDRSDTSKRLASSAQQLAETPKSTEPVSRPEDKKKTNKDVFTEGDRVDENDEEMPGALPLRKTQSASRGGKGRVSNEAEVTQTLAVKRRTREPSSQPISPPVATRKSAARRTRPSRQPETDSSLPGAFPGVVEEPSVAQQAGSDDEAVNKKPSKRAKHPPPAASALARMTRAQSVASSEGGEERQLRRSSRLSSLAPTSPSMSEGAAVQGGRARRATSARQESVTPRKSVAGGVAGGARARRQGSQRHE